MHLSKSRSVCLPGSNRAAGHSGRCCSSHSVCMSGFLGRVFRIPPPWVFAPLFQLAYPAQKKCDDISATAQDFVMSGLLCLDPAAMLMFMR